MACLLDPCLPHGFCIQWNQDHRDPDPVFQQACNHAILSLSLVDACTGYMWHACLTHACHMVFSHNRIRIIVIQIQYYSRRGTTQSSLIDACAGCMWHACLTRPCSACKQRTPSAARTVLWSWQIWKDYHQRLVSIAFEMSPIAGVGLWVNKLEELNL